MSICVLGSVMGTPKHVLCEERGAKLTWVNEIPDGAWVLGNSGSLNDLASLSNLHVDVWPSEAVRDSFIEMGVSSSQDVQWVYALPKRDFTKFARRLLDDAWDVVESGHVDYYKSVFGTTTQLLDDLEPACVDVAKLKRHITETPHYSVQSTLNTFLPKHGEFAEKVIYNRFSSRTGRLTVESGPNILTLKKEFRDIIKSRFEGGKIVQLDFKSLEARIALELAGKTALEDIYEDVRSEVFGNTVDRKIAKITTMATIFGVGQKKLGDLIGLKGRDLRSASKGIEKYFDVKRVSAKLKRTHKKLGDQNFYGRPLRLGDVQPHVLYNNVIQSTGVDVALLGFSKIVSKIKEEQMDIVPIFVLHDAIFLDVHPGAMECIFDLKSIATNIPKFTNKFYLDEEVLV